VAGKLAKALGNVQHNDLKWHSNYRSKPQPRKLSDDECEKTINEPISNMNLHFLKNLIKPFAPQEQQKYKQQMQEDIINSSTNDLTPDFTLSHLSGNNSDLSQEYIP
jgi:hypothetical protein